MARIQIIQSADAPSLAAFDTVIDVRSPGEFAEDHAPGAINLPVLTDAERAEVGTIYVQDSRFKANRIGAAYVARNIARHLETALADKPADFAPLVYCWRGGSRSEAMATILSRVGWRTSILAGGYRTYRRGVQASLYETPCPLKLLLLDGDTGTAKTEILARLSARGVQVLDLEGLAGHRGSLFGALAGRPQPSQKMFETELLLALQALDPARPVVVEAESSKIGDRMIPPALWQVMQAAPRVEVIAPRPVRAAYLVATYHDIVADPVALEAAFHRLPVYPGQRRLEDWRKLAGAGDFVPLAEAVMELHYDPAYRRARRKDGRPALASLELTALDDAAQAQAADQIARLVQTLPL
ncbi:tRNA 2-selenouridine(34) synthase MnmH [Phenylobacterium aquaticum]|uniref:tRNA 2-selenouridine(34) synthase MnmH n=1 Tax=Phenylobacterium aquaticum TaxID=1763816 RepID=UPI0026E99A27|nr:tRNA 2-selenouridine(34) synthase MnmH [Phenylobacterium aquaticum]